METVHGVQKKIDTLRIYKRNKDGELIKQKQLYEKRLDEISSLKMEII